jgi:hypothetical protein
MIDLAIFRRVALRAWAIPEPKQRRRRKRRRRDAGSPIMHALVLDTETTVDQAQALLFGAFRYCRIDGATVTTVAEGLIVADDLPTRDPAGYACLRRYAATHKADVDMTYLAVEPNWELSLLTRTEFVDRWLWHVGYPHNNRRDPAMIVMFNAPFDLSRLAVDVSEARDDMHGGFSLTLWQTPDGHERPWRPRLAIKVLDSKRAIKKFRGLERGKGNHSGHLLDLRTLVFALTGGSHSLQSACTAFGLAGKASAPEFGVITEEAIDYCRQDVTATTALLQAVLAELARHPVELQPTLAYSPASVAKAYLTAMGVVPRLVAQPTFPAQLLGSAMSAFYGGRAEIHIRHVPLPVRLVDFTSMYPSVDVLLGLWPLVTAERIATVEVTDEINQLLASITLAGCFDPARWRDWVVIADIVPDGDVLPVRADYRDDDDVSSTGTDRPGQHTDPGTQNWSIGVNPLHAEQALPYALPDLIAAKLLTGRAPTVRRAVRFVPVGRQPGLVPVRLRGDLEVNPSGEDFFQRVVEARQQARSRVPDHPHERCLCQDCGLARFLKTLANSGSYGIYAEMIRHELALGAREPVTVHGPTPTPFRASVSAPEEQGKFCFPPIAAVITAAARLMLAMLERAITDAGGTWMFCDTDSMAIVATEHGGVIACPGEGHQLPDGTPAVRALSYAQVDDIRNQFRSLNPYNPDLVDDLLKIDTTGTCYTISAKRYVITKERNGEQVIVKRSQHGLGRYLDPLSPKEVRRDEHGNPLWIDEAWQWILDAHHNPDTPLPSWAGLPALSRVTVSSPALLRPFSRWNRDRVWRERMKPSNFLLVATVIPFGHPPGTDPARFRLIAPYTSNPDEWPELQWHNMYDPGGPSYRITTEWTIEAESNSAIVQSYADVLRGYRLHPEHKFYGPDGQPCGRLTRGVLQRRPVHLTGHPALIGKEANRLDDVQGGLVGSLGEVLTEYTQPTADTIHRLVLPVLDRFTGRHLARLAGADRRTIDRIRKGQRPHAGLTAQLLHLAVEIARADLEAAGYLNEPHDPVSPIAFLTAWRQLQPLVTDVRPGKGPPI